VADRLACGIFGHAATDGSDARSVPSHAGVPQLSDITGWRVSPKMDPNDLDALAAVSRAVVPVNSALARIGGGFSDAQDLSSERTKRC